MPASIFSALVSPGETRRSFCMARPSMVSPRVRLSRISPFVSRRSWWLRPTCRCSGEAHPNGMISAPRGVRRKDEEAGQGRSGPAGLVDARRNRVDRCRACSLDVRPPQEVEAVGANSAESRHLSELEGPQGRPHMCASSGRQARPTTGVAHRPTRHLRPTDGLFFLLAVKRGLRRQWRNHGNPDPLRQVP